MEVFPLQQMCVEVLVAESLPYGNDYSALWFWNEIRPNTGHIVRQWRKNAGLLFLAFVI